MARRVLTTAALAIGSLVVFLALLEGSAALLGVAPLSEDPQQQTRLRQRSCMFGYGHAERACDASHLEKIRRERKARHLVLALGGSSVAGYAVSRREAFPNRLDAMLETAFPGEYAVVNLGRPCKDSIYVRRCVAAAMAAKPDLLVIYAGHNDYANWLASPTLRIALEEHGWLYDVETALRRSRAYSFVASRLVTVPPRPGGFWSSDHSPAALEEAAGVVLETYTRNLEEVIEQAATAGSRVLLVTVVSNLHEFPHRREAWDLFLHGRRLSETEAPWAEHYAAGISAFRAGRFAEALAAFTRARDARPAGRARSELNERVRELSRTYPYVSLLDFEAEVSRAALRDGVGCNLFGDRTYCDQFHLNVRTHEWLARRLATEIGALRGSESAPGLGGTGGPVPTSRPTRRG